MKNSFIVTLLFTVLYISCTSKSNESPSKPITVDPIPNPVDNSYTIAMKDFKMRDPFVYVDTISKKYYIPASTGDNQSFTMYESKDLMKWKSLGKAFIASPTFWGKSDFWAPDMFEYKGKFYLIATFSAAGFHRGCSILVSDTPAGPYTPLTNKPVTPANWGCLDGTLVIDNNQPYLMYCREWLEVGDGQMYIQKLSDDLSKMVGEPQLLFSASSASWVGPITSEGVTGFVTDAPFIYKTSENKLIMLWSSFAKSNGKYSIGVARSTSGLIAGPWVQDPKPLNNDDGGHAMLFKSLDGKLKISYHLPNTYPNYVTIYDVEVFEDNVTIIN
jgi:beta-xylosidase